MSKSENNFDNLRYKLEKAGFIFECEQKPFGQKRHKELKFIHPELIQKFYQEGKKIRAKKYYIKPLKDLDNSEIGLVTGKTSPFADEFIKPNDIDSYDNCPAWVNREKDDTLDILLNKIILYLNNSN